MAALFKYLAGIAVFLPATTFVFAMTVSAIFGGFATIAQAPVTERPKWNIERLKAAPDTPNIALGSLSPIYPATPGKELLEKPDKITSAKQTKIHQALQLHKLPRQIYSANEEDGRYPQQILGYAGAQPSEPLKSLISIIFGHGLY
jgi:hypothetical protein